MPFNGFETELPSQRDSDLARNAKQVLDAHAPAAGLRVHLDDGQELVLPQAAAQLLAHLLEEMSAGNAVTLIPIHAELTTQQAADLLNVSRPFLIQLLDTGRIPYHKTGTHRRVRFADLQAFRRQFEAEREKAMEALAQQAQELEMGY